MGREREAVVSLMQFINKGSELQIRSAVTLDHLKSNIYIEADKEAHVEDVCTRLNSFVRLLLFRSTVLQLIYSMLIRLAEVFAIYFPQW